ncbi:hypothetical protein A0256_04405 [Mucilaginibacter sp. PAMC 26640]|nr:hypothetical protein A0256_04405 [Mucilaginibacter sp. PAMC 26640]
MIYTESKKLHLIESLIKEKDDAVLKEIENILTKSTDISMRKFGDFSNVLTQEELNEFEKNIRDGCEQINKDDWK